MKKIAVVADIHANRYALEEFMKYINKENIEIILNMGDFVQIGPNPFEVSEIILKDKRFINILGNNEISLFNIDNKEKKEEINHRKWTKQQLHKNFETIKSIPQKRIINIDGKNILMIHSRKNNITDMPLIYTENIDKFTNDYNEFESDIVLFGHTHEKLYIEHNNKLFINPGSLGCSKVGTVDFAILEMNNRQISNCIFKSLEYDKSKLIKDYSENLVPDREFIMKTFYGLLENTEK